MLTISPKFLGDRKSPNPQKLEEIIQDDISSQIFNQPLDLVIQNLRTLRQENTVKARLRHARYHTDVYLVRERLETASEVEARLETQRRYALSKMEYKQNKIKELEKMLANLRTDVQKLSGVS